MQKVYSPKDSLHISSLKVTGLLWHKIYWNKLQIKSPDGVLLDVPLTFFEFIFILKVL